MSFQNAKVVSTGTMPDGYHEQAAKRGSKEFAISPSSLREFYRCPRRWIDGYVSPDSDAKDYGSLLDCRWLTPADFDKRYGVKPLTYPDTKTKEPKPWNGNATFCRDWAEAQGHKEIISANDLSDCDAAIKRLMQDEIIAAFFESSDKQVLVSGEWEDEKTGLTVPVRCLMDFVPKKDTEFEKCLGDLKSTRNAGLGSWNRWCFTAGYHIQAGFDLDLYVEATQEDRSTWCFVVQENFHPWQTAKRMLSQEHGLDLGRIEYQRMLALYCRCLKSGQWPDYDQHDEAVQGWSIVAAEPFQESRLLFEPKTVIGDEAEEQNGDDVIP